MWTRRKPDADPEAAAAAVRDWLDVGNGHRLYFEDRGPRDAPVMLLLHGGPGSSATARQREWLDARRWRIVQFDQRGCGLSTPLGGIAHNDTQALVDDIERLRTHLGIDRWAVGAGSWGAALAVVYAGGHRDRVMALVLRGVFLATRADLDWFFHGVQALAPDAHAELMATIPHRWRDEPVSFFARDLGRDNVPVSAFDQTIEQDVTEGEPSRDAPLTAYGSLTSAQPSGQSRAFDHALACQRYESALESAAPDATPPPADADAAQRLLARYRVWMHYLAHDCFLDDDAVLRAATALHGVPVAIVHGEHDLTCRPSNAHDLERACPDARLAWARGARHNPFHPAAAALLRDAGACLLRDGHFASWPSPGTAAERGEPRSGGAPP